MDLDTPVFANDQSIEDIIKNNTTVVVYFGSTDFKPNKFLLGFMDHISSFIKHEAVVAKIDSKESPDFFSKNSILYIPTVIIFNNGNEVARLIQNSIQFASIMQNIEVLRNQLQT